MYYYKGERSLRPSISQWIILDGIGNPNSIEVEIFGHMTFSKAGNEERVEHIEGHWFDLNGNMSRLFALLDLRTAAAFKNEQFHPLKLSDVPIHQTNFDADMGTVMFNR